MNKETFKRSVRPKLIEGARVLSLSVSFVATGTLGMLAHDAHEQSKHEAVPEVAEDLREKRDVFGGLAGALLLGNIFNYFDTQKRGTSTNVEEFRKILEKAHEAQIDSVLRMGFKTADLLDELADAGAPPSELRERAEAIRLENAEYNYGGLPEDN